MSGTITVSPNSTTSVALMLITAPSSAIENHTEWKKLSHKVSTSGNYTWVRGTECLKNAIDFVQTPKPQHQTNTKHMKIPNLKTPNPNLTQKYNFKAERRLAIWRRNQRTQFGVGVFSWWGLDPRSKTTPQGSLCVTTMYWGLFMISGDAWFYCGMIFCMVLRTDSLKEQQWIISHSVWYYKILNLDAPEYPLLTEPSPSSKMNNESL